MNEWLYFLATQFYFSAIHIAAKAGHTKAATWIDKRKRLVQKIQHSLKYQPSKKTIWVHCASRGETEQAIPLMRSFRRSYKDCRIILTIFSPSGERHVPEADFTFYLPKDTPKNAKRIVALFRPSLAVFVKYDLWYFYLKQLKRSKVHCILISAIFRKEQLFFKPPPFSNIARKMLRCFSQLYIQDEKSKALLEKIGFKKNVYVCGDTRFDRVIEYTKATGDSISIQGKKPLIVCGSTWNEDHAILEKVVVDFPSYLFAIVPHQVDASSIQSARSYFPKARLFSNTKTAHSSTSNVLIVDKMGILNLLYKKAKIAYVGGGFSRGIHNILEPAAHGIPVLFGPKHKKYREATIIQQYHAGTILHTSTELKKTLRKCIEDSTYYKHCSTNAQKFIKENSGATNCIFQHLKQLSKKRQLPK